MGKLEDYEQYYTKYRQVYGDKTAIFYQIGKFHEMYGVDNEHERIGNVTEISSLLGIRETRVSTAILENNRSNPQMAGFNSVSLDANVEKLVGHGYTVVVINQIPNTDPVKRKIAYIASPSTYLETDSPQEPYLVSIYIHQSKNRSTQKSYYYIGMAAIDVTTGQNVVYESNSTPEDPCLATDDLVRFLQTFCPVEVVLNHSDAISREDELDDMIRTWGYKRSHSGDYHQITELKPTVYTDTQPTLSSALKPQYQDEYFGNVFKTKSNCIEYLGLERLDMARIAYLCMLQFCAEHNADLLSAIQKPEQWRPEDQLILDTSSIIQLNISEGFYNQRRATVANLIQAQTPMGRRLLKHRLLSPVTSPEVLMARYRQVELMGTSIPDTEVHLVRDKPTTTTISAYVKKSLSGVRDLDRLHRKIILGKLTPEEFYILHTCYSKILPMLTHLHGMGHYTELTQSHASLQQFMGLYTKILNIEEAGKCKDIESMKDSIFNLGWNTEIDALSSAVRQSHKVQRVLCQHVSDLISKGSAYCKYKEEGTGEDCYCTMTKPQYKKFVDAFDEEFRFTVDGEQYHVQARDIVVDDRNKSNVKLKIKVLTEQYNARQKHLSELSELSIKLYRELLSSFSKDYDTLRSISGSVAALDLYRSVADHSLQRGYCKPEICVADHGAVCATGLRHPLVEHNNIYVAQDITLDGDRECTGMLLYGVNQSGKSCTMKSVGIAVIMAQAGFYVPAQKFVLSPYRQLMTRIIGNDNIDKGLSTFAVEMTELRGILTRAGPHSLILGDEVCHGTESASAVSLVASSIVHLSQCKSSFIFATHLHELSGMKEIGELNNVRQFHLTISFGPDDTIVYNRVMKEGSGLGLYGIEVAKHLRLPADVVEMAYRIRNKYYAKAQAQPTEITEIRPSAYNEAVVLGRCKIPDCDRAATQTHHIMEQSESDERGLIGGAIHKNNSKNLLPICDEHHDMIHHGTVAGVAGEAVDGDTCKVLAVLGYNMDGSLQCVMRNKLKSLDVRDIVIPRVVQLPSVNPQGSRG